MIISFFLRCYYRNNQKTFFVPEINMYVRIQKYSFNDARIDFSRTNEFGKDYIEYKIYPDGEGIDIYYLRPKSFYAVNSGNIINIKNTYFHINEVKDNIRERMAKDIISDRTNWYLKPYLRAMKDSVFLNNDYLLFSVWGTQWLNIIKSNGDILFSTNNN